MSILNDIDDVIAEGNVLAPLINCINLINECETVKQHNKACKLLVNILGKKSLDIRDDDLFDINRYNYVATIYSEGGWLKSSTKPVLVYSPPRGGRAAIIHIFNAIKDFDNLKIEGPGNCHELSYRCFDVYPGTTAFDLTDESISTNLLSKHLKVFQW